MRSTPRTSPKSCGTATRPANGADSFGYSIKFGSPTIANGEVLLGTNTNALVGFGLQPPPNSPPAAPSNLAATAPSSTSIKLTWTDNSTSPNVATSFTIQDSTDGVNYTAVATAPGGTTASTVGGLTSATTYTFRIGAPDSVATPGYARAPPVTTPTASGSAPAINFPDGFAAGTSGVLTFN